MFINAANERRSPQQNQRHDVGFDVSTDQARLCAAAARKKFRRKLRREGWFVVS